MLAMVLRRTSNGHRKHQNDQNSDQHNLSVGLYQDQRHATNRSVSQRQPITNFHATWVELDENNTIYFHGLEAHKEKKKGRTEAIKKSTREQNLELHVLSRNQPKNSNKTNLPRMQRQNSQVLTSAS